eukprot:scaffold33564_cov69-Phaeocystis_antarctica.AAC.6
MVVGVAQFVGHACDRLHGRELDSDDGFAAFGNGDLGLALLDNSVTERLKRRTKLLHKEQVERLRGTRDEVQRVGLVNICRFIGCVWRGAREYAMNWRDREWAERMLMRTVALGMHGSIVAVTEAVGDGQ